MEFSPIFISNNATKLMSMWTKVSCDSHNGIAKSTVQQTVLIPMENKMTIGKSVEYVLLQDVKC